MNEGEQTIRWERDLVERLAQAGLEEQRRKRRWSIFFRFLFFAYALALLLLLVDWDLLTEQTTAGKHTGRVELKGLIAEGSDGDAHEINELLTSAFEDKSTQGVILEINSPGGTPVQASYIYDHIKYLRKKHPDIKLYAVVSDICASGGYYVASAADAIYAARGSIVGSIGVRLDNFGVQNLIAKLGIENRTITAGDNKAILDPFAPLAQEQKEHLQAMLNEVHEQFIQAVKTGRGDRLRPNPDLFSGLIWTGEKAKDLGLVDGFGDVDYVAREIIGEQKVVTYSPAKSLLEQLTERVETSIVTALHSLTLR